MEDAFIRGLALFFGLFGLASTIGALGHGAIGQGIWWVDLSAVPSWLAVVFQLVASVLLLLWSLGTGALVRLRKLSALAAFALCATAIVNTVGFYETWRAGMIAPMMPLPVSALYAIGFAWIGMRAFSDEVDADRRSGAGGVALALVALLISFPLIQIAFFGTTDYRRSADVAVVLGARVYDNGVLSTALADRVSTGVELYRAGLVHRLVMSGGTGANGVDETVAMQRAAVAAGVPSEAIVRDPAGDNTDATVANTTAIMSRGGHTRVLIVSQFWHLPRTKLAYLGAGWNVWTVPATTSLPIWQTPYLIAREVPAFWQYWLRSL